MTTLAAQPLRDVVSFGRGCAATRTALNITRELDVDEWESLLGRVVAVSDASAWWIGDVLSFGEWRYGEKYRTVLAVIEFEYERARNYAYVSGNVPAAVRRADLSWSHHRIVAPLVPAEQERWLSSASENGWSVRELQEALDAAARNQESPADELLEQLRFTVDRDRLERWQRAAEREADGNLTDWACSVLDRAAGAT